MIRVNGIAKDMNGMRAILFYTKDLIRMVNGRKIGDMKMVLKRQKKKENQ